MLKNNKHSEVSNFHRPLLISRDNKVQRVFTLP
jgi:hypothetical protein